MVWWSHTHPTGRPPPSTQGCADMRQKLSDRELLRRVIRQWDEAGHADNLDVATDPSTRATAAFLWGVAGALFVALTWTVFDTFSRAEQHRDDAARSTTHAPGTDHGVTKASGEGQDVGHAAQPDRPSEVRP